MFSWATVVIRQKNKGHLNLEQGFLHFLMPLYLLLLLIGRRQAHRGPSKTQLLDFMRGENLDLRDLRNFVGVPPGTIHQMHLKSSSKAVPHTLKVVCLATLPHAHPKPAPRLTKRSIWFKICVVSPPTNLPQGGRRPALKWQHSVLAGIGGINHPRDSGPTWISPGRLYIQIPSDRHQAP